MQGKRYVFWPVATCGGFDRLYDSNQPQLSH